MIVPSTTLANVAVRDRSNAVTKGKSQDTVAIEYSCNECGDEFEIFRDLAKHKRAAQCKGDEIDDVWTEEMFEKSPSVGNLFHNRSYIDCVAKNVHTAFAHYLSLLDT